MAGQNKIYEISCELCGNPKKTMNKKQRFCGHKCARLWVNQYHKSIGLKRRPPQSKINKNCHECHATFKPMYDSQKCCSHICGIKYREKCKLPDDFKYNFFDAINPTVAYWAGFIIGDGSFQREGNNNTLSIGLNSKDFKHLELFKEEMGASHVNLSYYKNVCYLRFSHKYLRDSLSKWGIIPNKTYDLREIPGLWSGPKIISHFIRGLWDADGSIIVPRNNGRVVGGNVSIVGSSWIINWLNIILISIGFGTYLQQGKEKILDDGTLYHTTKLSIPKQSDSIRFIKWIGYLDDNLPSLERKRDSAKAINEWYTEKQLPRICPGCNCSFSTTKQNQTFCSKKCRGRYNTMAYRQRLKKKQECFS